MTRWTTWIHLTLGACALAVLSSCMAADVVPADNLLSQQMTPEDARRAVAAIGGRATLYGRFPCGDWQTFTDSGCGDQSDPPVFNIHFSVKQVVLTPHEMLVRNTMITNASDNGLARNFHYRLFNIQPTLLMSNGNSLVGANLPFIALYGDIHYAYFVLYLNDGTLEQNLAEAKKIAAGLQLLKQAANTDSAEEQAHFNELAATYRAASPKPVPSEEIRKLFVQAQGALNDKDFFTAEDLYGQALEKAPWWPDGHYNRAVILGGIGDFQDAITEMQRYLALVPEAPNARADQDAIYDWQRKLANEGSGELGQ